MIARHVLLIALLLGVGLNAGPQEDDSLSIGPRFHHETSFDYNGFVGERISRGNRVPLYKEYASTPRTALPVPAPVRLSLDSALQLRKSVRTFSSRDCGLDHLAGILLAAAGLTHRGHGFDFRTAPSGGALYPIDIYVIAHRVESLAPGLYHYQVSDSSLELVKEGSFDDAIHQACHEQASVGVSPVTLALTARFNRSTRKYADRGYRYTYIECGSICQNIGLEAAGLGMGTVAIGAFNDKALNDLLGIDGYHEAALLVMPVGYPAEK